MFQIVCYNTCMHTLIIASGNQGKIAEFSRLLARDIAGKKLVLPEIQSTDVRKVARAKAEAAYAQLGTPVFVDDTGLYIDAWNQLPGALIAWFLDNVGNEGILKMLEGWKVRSARVVTALGYCDEHGSRVFVGELTGSIADVPRGDNGFGYDPIFIPEGTTKTFAEMTDAEKDAVSMRARAAAAMQEGLEW